MAWHPLGWTPVAFSEIEPFPSAVLAHHYPHVPNLGDMTKFQEWPEFNESGNRVDLLVGGTPCQSFSVAGLRKGLADPRGNLCLTFLGIADKYRPKWIVWENVPGVLSSNGGRDFGSFLGALVQLGYGFAYRVQDAQYFGVPQRRRRVFVVGCLGDWRSAAAVLFERHSLQRNSPPSRKAGESVANCLGVSSASHSGPNVANGQGNIVGTLTARGVNSLGAPEVDAGHFLPVAYRTTGNHGCYETGDQVGALTCSTDRNAQIVAFTCKDHGADAGDLAPTLRAMGHGVSHANAGGQVAVVFQSSQSGVRTAEVHATLDSNNGSRRHNGVIQASAVRRLTPTECERLQGFPDGYTLIRVRGKPAADRPRYKALGNSMAVPVMRWIGTRIQAVEVVSPCW